ncbi:MAG: hypothetical protein GX591_06725 [Planctomycetes bacterium]|nr:hypothetical protein [Planctomycetota bacterium]
MVIRTERGVELGTVVGALKPGQAPPPPPPVVEGGPDDPPPCGSHNGCTVSCGQVENLLRAGGTELSFNRQNKILRLASPQDVNDQEHLDRNEREKRVYCGQQARELGLRMRLVTVEHLLGGERVVFYFTSDSRVDFRELVRRLAAQYRTRIEMRQIGARDEARLVADYERCGQRCCCQAFLGTLQPVSIRMAKVQKATLDPSKISGRCNRLMCCLRYEDETYEFLRRQLPRKNTWVRTADVVGKVVAAQLLTQLVRLIDAEGTMVVVENAAILERDVTAPPPGTTAPRPERRPSRPQRPAAPVEAPVEPAGPPEAPGAETGGEESSDAATKRRRRRRRRRKPDAPGAEAAPPADGGTQAPDGAPRKKRRRRRRRGKAEGEADNAPPAEG